MRAALLEAADPERAPRMQAYMKSEMPYRGIAAPDMLQARLCEPPNGGLR
jgi:hypothetical protein